jgi:DUF1009 family protein
VIAAARKGDDALLRLLVGEFEKEGFAVEGAHEVMDDLSLQAGPLGARRPATTSWPTRRRRWSARAHRAPRHRPGRVVASGLVLAVEAQEGTDACWPGGRAAGASAGRRAPASACWPRRPSRSRRPRGPADHRPGTVAGVARAGLAGIVGEAGACWCWTARR